MAREFHVDLDLNAHKITDVAPGTAGTDAVNKNQLDAAAGGTPEVYAQTTAPGAGATDVVWVDIDDTSIEPSSVWRSWVGTQAQYDAISVKDPGTLYAVVPD